MNNFLSVLNILASQQSSITQDLQVIVNTAEQSAKSIIGGLDIEYALQQFKDWFLRLLQSEPPALSIQALNFGLFQSKDGGFSLYVCGANVYDREDPDWVITRDWYPEERYALITALTTLNTQLFHTKEQSWQVAQAVAIIIIKAFFIRFQIEFGKVWHARSLYVVTGFDDGDLFEIWTPFTPKL